MKKLIAIALCLCLLLPLLSGCKGGSDAPSSGTAAKAWVEKQIDDDTLFSFTYDGVPFADFISGWEKSVDKGTDDNGNTTLTLTYAQKDDQVTAQALITLYKASDAVEWVIHFQNEGKGDSPVIGEIQAMDTIYEDGIDATLGYAKGSTLSEEDFTPLSAQLKDGENVTLYSSSGLSSNEFMPYFDIVSEGKGIIGAIGWTGSWKCVFRPESSGVRMTAGMTETRISLHAGEQMRTPSIVFLFFEGDAAQGHNAWRSFLINQLAPKTESGEPITELPIFVGAWGADGETKMLNTIKRMDQRNQMYDGIWVDAGWYGSEENIAKDTYANGWYEQVGSWNHLDSLYPEGFKNVSNALHERDLQFLLWFEPERVMNGSTFQKQHPEYLIQSSAGSFFLINLADDEATDFLIDFMDAKIKEYGMDWYRQDFNCTPAQTWASTDNAQGENRKGITEIHYITNLYRYLDTLVERNPGLMIDNCASGGRRLDIEMMRRSYPLHRSDHPLMDGSTADTVRELMIRLSYWLPLSGGGASKESGLLTPYDWRSQMAASTSVSSTPPDVNYYNTMLEQHYRCKPMIAGDYYILTEHKNAKTDNSAYMYYLPDSGEGYLLLFRPKESAVAQQKLYLRGLDADADYLLENADTGETLTVSGALLMEKGLDLTLDAPRSSALIYFTRQ